MNILSFVVPIVIALIGVSFMFILSVYMPRSKYFDVTLGVLNLQDFRVMNRKNKKILRRHILLYTLVTVAVTSVVGILANLSSIGLLSYVVGVLQMGICALLYLPLIKVTRRMKESIQIKVKYSIHS